MFQNIGIPGLILILIIALIIFGPSKLPEIGRAFGRTLSEFKNATKELVSGEKDNDTEKVKEIDKEIDKEKESKPELAAVDKNQVKSAS